MRAVKAPTTLLALLGTASLVASMSVAAQEAPAQEPPAEQTVPVPSVEVEQPSAPPAQEASVPVADPVAPMPPIETPAPGSTMDTVRAKFGAPSSEEAPVGQPPISRWEYPGYIVYFEYDKVLHTVVMRKPNS